MNCLTIFLLVLILSFGQGKDTLLNELKKIYKKIALQYHPDKQNYSPELSNIIFSELTNIYQTFSQIVGKKSNPEKECKTIRSSMYERLEYEYGKLMEDYKFAQEDFYDVQQKIIAKRNELNEIIKKINKQREIYNNRKTNK